MTAESLLLKNILLKYGARPDLRIWRNNTGQAWTGNNVLNITRAGQVTVAPGDVVISQAHPIKFGLPGSPDILGILGPEGRWIGIEVKGPKGRVSEQQKRFHAMMQGLGGLVVVARDVADVGQILK